MTVQGKHDWQEVNLPSIASETLLRIFRLLYSVCSHASWIRSRSSEETQPGVEKFSIFLKFFIFVSHTQGFLSIEVCALFTSYTNLEKGSRLQSLMKHLKGEMMVDMLASVLFQKSRLKTITEAVEKIVTVQGEAIQWTLCDSSDYKSPSSRSLIRESVHDMFRKMEFHHRINSCIKMQPNQESIRWSSSLTLRKKTCCSLCCNLYSPLVVDETV